MPVLRWDLDDVRERARAAFLGVAIGDALGATVEFMTPGEIQAAHGVHRDLVGGGWLHLRAGQVTDDTEMSLCVARAVVAAGGWSRRAVADGFAAWLRGRPTDVGATCRRGIRAYLLEGTLEVPRREGDAGNGAAMRVLPVALLALADFALAGRLAVEQAHLTHHHPLSDAACRAVARLVQLACLGLSLRRLRAEADALCAAQPRFAFEPYPGLTTGYVVDTLQTVLHFLFGTRSFEECLVAVVNQGGDADTTGAIAGAIAGAYHGLEGIPGRWLRRLDRAVAAEAVELADALVALSPLARGEPPRFLPER
jgi:ADP-ribosyl-[dinitrogen reductase] hydrolase